ncbi:5-carboxymethyl-2-hydroxymuconate isomerase [Variovorax sp. PBL-E5]|uniref:5-carboxymethyl-2-hydroxymuconate isomerase n=1 Tax=Variovorax sp. PBL-E5 TaxID=434014 RepID=UPI001317DB29|nr:5-carboxymethyl-2-hydroxymuconate isomerase [Variovorax sp. PBL-E5]VTU34461.1 5-carboxymethyl-2-hydroxymuconate delta-isomerase [Variovorax sp. PBL-E5]
MPHLVIEYSVPLNPPNAQRLCRATAESLRAHVKANGSPEYPPSGTFVRAYRAEATQHAEDRNDAHFVHAILKIGPGRDDPTKERTGKALLQALQAFFEQGTAASVPTISVELLEFPQTLWRA